MSLSDEIRGINSAYLAGLFDDYLHSPESVPEEIRAFFASQAPSDLDISTVPVVAESRPVDAADYRRAVKVAQLAQAIRSYGHFASPLDPLGSLPAGDPALNLAYHQVTEDDLLSLPAALVEVHSTRNYPNALEAVNELLRIYTGPIGFDFLQIRLPAERDWLRDAVESGRYSTLTPPLDRVALLERLTEVEAFEHFLQKTFPGKTRFSIEGLDMLVPMLDELASIAATERIQNVLIGMAHRGRLNVLAHVLGKPYAEILAEFKDPLERRMRPDYLGDVKYHMGARHSVHQEGAASVSMVMAPNPSHLEAVNPVVEGMARAAGTEAGRPGAPAFNSLITLPVLIHGDAAFPGQGVVAETFNLYNLSGYTTGGTIHIIANNQIGFTTDPPDSRSTIFASDLAKGFRAPIVHVNADHPEACVAAIRLAMAYRQRFNKDFVIDLIGYRRPGHNEGDEPAFTQPEIYQKIQNHPSVRTIWANFLTENSQVDPGFPTKIFTEKMEKLQSIYSKMDLARDISIPEPLPQPCQDPECEPETSITNERLSGLVHQLDKLPDGFDLNPKLVRQRARRDRVLEDANWPNIDWAQAEELAFASILEDGTPIRLTGQDVERGTFSHRHAVLHDIRRGEEFIPLQSLPQARASFEIHNSPLSELAALGFEYGFNVYSPRHLIVWEAQYGDFINGAQSIIDEFVVSASSKWAQRPSLVILLPHGYEGQGPDHSSGRLERFLNLYADQNLRVANCTTAAQYFHLLRRQAVLLESAPAPLVIMTPKSLLRHPVVASAPRELMEGRFSQVLDDVKAPPFEEVQRLVICSGKLAVDLTVSDLRAAAPHTAIIRLEMLAPFPVDSVRDFLSRYPNLIEVVWAQEEPQNMGAWEFVRPFLEDLMDGRWPLKYVGRPRSASPSEGSSALHAYHQRKILEAVLSDHI